MKGENNEVSMFSTQHERFPYSEFFWSVFSPNAGKYGPEKLRIWTLVTQCCLGPYQFSMFVLFCKISKRLKSKCHFAKSSFTDVWKGLNYVPAFSVEPSVAVSLICLEDQPCRNMSICYMNFAINFEIAAGKRLINHYVKFSSIRDFV